MGQIKKIMLVTPNSKWLSEGSFWHLHPYPLTLLASALPKGRYDVRIVDSNLEDHSPEKFSDLVKSWAPDVVGVSVLANEYLVTGLKAVGAVKSVNPGIVTVMGGVCATTRPLDVIRNPNVDFAVLGEGEYVFPKLLDFIEGNGEFPAEGVARMAGDKPDIRRQVHFIKDLDALPFPSNDLIDFDRYANESFKHIVDAPRALPYAKMITSRGCPIGCTFCQVETISGGKTRFQSAKRVVDEIEWLIDKHGIRAIEFLDDNFLGNRSRAVGIFKEMIARKLPVAWNAANVSEFFLSEELLALMKESGCVYLSIAVESGVPRVLKEIIRKPVNLTHAKKMLDTARELGMDTTSLWVIGSPGETWEEIRHSIRVAEEMNSDYTKINIATPYPGTELFNMAVAGGYLSKDFDFSDIGWGLAAISTEEFSVAQLTILRAFEWDRLNFTNEEKRAKIARMMGVTLDELASIRKSTLQRALQATGKAANANLTDKKVLPPGNVGDIAIVTAK
ncbi:MAG: radical SAM protein [Nitrospinae bacterium]|nr:radical SAM protein [Nitrospinota bacterium]